MSNDANFEFLHLDHGAARALRDSLHLSIETLIPNWLVLVPGDQGPYNEKTSPTSIAVVAESSGPQRLVIARWDHCLLLSILLAVEARSHSGKQKVRSKAIPIHRAPSCSSVCEQVKMVQHQRSSRDSEQLPNRPTLAAKFAKYSVLVSQHAQMRCFQLQNLPWGGWPIHIHGSPTSLFEDCERHAQRYYLRLSTCKADTVYPSSSFAWRSYPRILVN